MTKKRAIDRIDLKILSILQDKARMTNHDLSSEVNLSPSSCLQRVRRLEEEGYIDRYMAVINLNKICRTVAVLLTVSLHDHSNANFKAFEKLINDFSEIAECFTVSGNFDYFLRVVCPDMDSYLKLNDKIIESMKDVANISSHVILSNSKNFRGYDLDQLID
ncbi:MAG: Lrp/AsnC family transcriptional regulator [Emcibacter sp.]|nr:Lrp/AsnC family transcriptional regulator [Emcibacter sp.]